MLSSDEEMEDYSDNDRQIYSITHTATQIEDGDRPYIRSIRMENFMCHTNFEIELIPRVNLICGTNGSGKSTILVALMTVLGSRAKDTGRGGSLEQLIMTGKNVAYAHVALHIPEEYNEIYQKFGDTVTISRKITKTTASYELRNSHGILVKKTGAKDVRDICNQFGIYPNNELAMLSQESAREFLVHVSPQKKYEKLHRALLKHRIGENQRIVNQIIQSQDLLIREKEQILKRHKSQETLAKHVLNQASMHREKRKLLEQIREVAAWRELQVVLERKNQATRDVENAETEIATISAQLESVRDIAPLETKHENLINQRTEIDTQISQTKDELMTAKSELQEYEELVNRVTEDVEIFNRQDQQIASEVKLLRRKMEDSSPEKLHVLRTKLQAEQKQGRATKAEMQAQIQQIDETIAQFRLEYESASEKLTPLLENQVSLNARKTQLLEELRSLENSNINGTQSNSSIRGGASKRYHEELRRLVDRDNGWEMKKPVGPLYNYMQIKDDGSEFVPALEQIWRSTLESWWVESKRDRERLRTLANSINRGFSFNILLRNDDRFNFDNELPELSEDYIRAVDVVEFSLEAVLRIMVDLNHIERLVLAPEIESAFRTTTHQPKVRDVLAIGQTRRGELTFQLITKIGSRRDTSFVSPNGLSLLKVGDEARRRLIRREAQNCESQIREISDQIILAKDEIRQIEKKIHAQKHQQAKISEDSAKIDSRSGDITAEISRIDTDFNDRNYEADLKALRRKHRQAIRNFMGASEAKEELQQDRDALNDKCTFLSQKYADQKNKYSEINDDIEKNQTSIVNFKTQFSKEQKILLTRQQVLEELQGDQRITEMEYADALREYYQNHTDLHTEDELREKNQFFNMSDQDLKEETEKLTSEEIVVRMTQEAIEEEQARYDVILRAKHATVKQLEEMNLNRNITLTGQKTREENEKRVWEEIKADIQEYFQRVLRMRHYTGEVIINDSKKQLTASACPDMNGVQGVETLSGGEKSLTQIALLMAVWQTMELGLVAMDEFDVFMDKVNRFTSLKCIGETAEAAKLQCIIITPQDVDTTALDGVDYVVRRLNPAR